MKHFPLGSVPVAHLSIIVFMEFNKKKCFPLPGSDKLYMIRLVKKVGGCVLAPRLIYVFILFLFDFHYFIQ